jgi:ketosteroid isomerase-like protein
MDRAEVTRWLERYVAAWKSYDRGAIGELFSEDAEYRYHPYDDPVRGRGDIVSSWFDDQDEPGTYDGRYEPIAVDGDVAVATGTSTYRSAEGKVERVYHNAYVMRFDGEGRCRSFTEWFMLQP